MLWAPFPPLYLSAIEGSISPTICASSMPLMKGFLPENTLPPKYMGGCCDIYVQCLRSNTLEIRRQEVEVWNKFDKEQSGSLILENTVSSRYQSAASGDHSRQGCRLESACVE